MKCPSCGYVSFGSPEKCKKCGRSLPRIPQEALFDFDREEGSAPQSFEPAAPAADEEIREGARRLREIMEGTRSAGRAGRSQAGEAPPAPPKREEVRAPMAGAATDAGNGRPHPPAAQGGAPEAPHGKARRAQPLAARLGPRTPAASPPEGHDPLEGILDSLFNECRPGAAPLSAPAASVPLPAQTLRAPTAPAPLPPEEAFLESLRIEMGPEEVLQEKTAATPSIPEAPLFPPRAENPPLQNLEEVPEAFLGEMPAGFLRRAGAFILDNLLVLLLIALFVLGAGVGLALKGGSPVWLASHSWPSQAWLPLLILACLVNAVYFISAHCSGGRTPGKRAFSIKVVDRAGGPLALNAAAMRWVGYLLSAAPAGAGFLWSLFSPSGLAWHDRMAGSMVVEDRIRGG